MRAIAPFILLLIVISGCRTEGGSASRPTNGAAPLSFDLLPFTASTAAFSDLGDALPRILRVEPSADGSSARLLLEGAGGPARELRATRRGDAVFVSGGVDIGTELIRIGAHPGEAWESGGMHVTFDGWERVTLAAANYDAARISTRRGPVGVQHVETWWFAPGVGLVRLRSDHATLFVDELVRSAP